MFLNNEITQNQKYCLLFKKFLLEEDYLEKINNECYAIDITYDQLVNNNFFNFSRFSFVFLCDSRIDNLIIKDASIYEKINI